MNNRTGRSGKGGHGRLGRQRRAARIAMAMTAATLAMSIGGCKNEKNELAAIFATAASPAAGRGTAATDIVTAFNAKTITFSAAMDLANAQLDEVAKGKVKSADATAYAGAVLDAAVRIEDHLPKGQEMEIMWITVGRLAFRAAEEAHAAGRSQEAMTLVFAGPERWQNGAYWERYSDHDGLAALLLAENGQQAQGIERLRSRGELRGVAAEVYEILTKQRPPQ